MIWNHELVCFFFLQDFLDQIHGLSVLMNRFCIRLRLGQTLPQALCHILCRRVFRLIRILKFLCLATYPVEKPFPHPAVEDILFVCVTVKLCQIPLQCFKFFPFRKLSQFFSCLAVLTQMVQIRLLLPHTCFTQSFLGLNFPLFGNLAGKFRVSLCIPLFHRLFRKCMELFLLVFRSLGYIALHFLFPAQFLLFRLFHAALYHRKHSLLSRLDICGIPLLLTGMLQVLNIRILALAEFSLFQRLLLHLFQSLCFYNSDFFLLLLLLLLAILIFFSHILLSPYKYRIYCCARISAFSLPNSPR